MALLNSCVKCVVFAALHCVALIGAIAGFVVELLIAGYRNGAGSVERIVHWSEDLK